MLKFYNSKTNQLETFTPIDPGRVTMYVCGPTVYDYIHIGNARPAVVFDVLYRLLKRQFPNVAYARNITDIDDKIIGKAREVGQPISNVANEFTEAYHADLAALGTLTPTFEPKATKHIPEMIALVQSLIDKGFAYAANQHVLFKIESMPDYGALSGRKTEDMLAGARVDIADYKKNPLDFILWKPSVDEQPGWDSPWGYGRPGWHLECSAMAQSLLGKRIDIHGGGQDLLFPHHENERAQSCCSSGEDEFANYWLHNGYVTMSGDKMSKSVGNVFTVRALLEQFSGETLRWVLLSAHYRKPLDWSEAVLKKAKASLDGLYQVLLDTAELPDIEAIPDRLTTFESALMNDLNTPLALSELHRLANDLRRTESLEEQARLRQTLLQCSCNLNLLTKTPSSWFKQSFGAQTLSDQTINQLIEERKQAKANKNFTRADQIRGQLQDAKIQLEDSASGTTWKRR